ncbi:MAG: M20 family metallopeptidase [Acidobacteriota bacterium]
MLRTITPAAAFLAACLLPGLAPALEAAPPELEAAVKGELPELVNLYQELHRHPELSFHEQATAARLAAELRRLGYSVTEQVGRYERPGLTSYGFVGVLENGPGPVVLLRTDLDALPVPENTGAPYASRDVGRDDAGREVPVMHACGHDVHMTTFLGTARLLARWRDRWSGTLVLVGQPAEERGAGARAMLADGLYERFPKPNYALAWHVAAELAAGRVAYCPGYALASVDSVDIEIFGRGGHGAYPHRTRDPIVMAAQTVVGLQTIVSRQVSPLDSAVVTVGSIHGGTKHNIIPDRVHLQLTVRSYQPEVRTLVLDSIRRIAEGIAAAADAPRPPEVAVDEMEHVPATYNDPELTERIADVFRRTLGEGRVVQTPPVMGGEDFSHYRQEGIQAAIFWLGAAAPEAVAASRAQGTPLPSLHSSEFLPDAPRAVRTGVTAMTAALLELLRP